MKTIVFANGEIKSPDAIDPILNSSKLIIAADGGLKHIRKLNLIPDVVIGDLDSITKEDLQWLHKKKIEVLKFPENKDQTDLELALLAALDRRGDPIIVVGTLGGRIDQTLANIFLLLMPELQGVDVRFDDGDEELFLIQNRAEIKGKKGDIVSLLPLLSSVHGIETSGLRFPLREEILFPERSRGVSNVMTSAKAEVTITSGLLLCIHTRKIKGV